jgi:integrase
MPIVRLTQNFITNNLHCPYPRLRIEYCDEELGGLYVEVRSTRQGHGTYYLRYKDHAGKTCHLKLGRTTDMALADARKQAKAFKAQIALGSDPGAEKKARRAIPTFTELFEEHYLPYVKPRKRSWKRDDELYRLRIKKVFGHCRLDQISRQQIQSFHTGLLEEGLAPATCDHHIKLMKHALNLAIDWQLLHDKNPASRVPLFSVDNKVEHYLDDAQLERLLTVLHSDANRTVCLIALFLISTGCRLNEVLSARWKQIDRANRVFRVDAINSKSKRVRSVPLNDSALEVLEKLDTEGKYEHLFINKKTEDPYTTIMKVWTRLRAKAGLPHLRIHDLRHQFASFLVNSGRTLYEVQQLLGHSDSKVTARYAHLSSKTLQDAANSASAIMKGSMKKAA